MILMLRVLTKLQSEWVYKNIFAYMTNTQFTMQHALFIIRSGLSMRNARVLPADVAFFDWHL